MDHCRPDDDLSDRSKHVVIITISKYSPVKDVLVFFHIVTFWTIEGCQFSKKYLITVFALQLLVMRYDTATTVFS